jgi:hypothetical protein
MPLNPSPNEAWGQTYPSSGSWIFDPLTSGAEIDDADFGNVVEYIRGLTWGYWKTHTGFDAPRRDETYDELESNPLLVDVMTPDGNYYVNDDWEALWIFDGAGEDEPPSARGNAISLFRCQLLALHMNLLKYDDMGEQTYHYPGDEYDGMTVQAIYDDLAFKLVDDPTQDFHDELATADRINNNGNYGPGDHVLYDPNPHVPSY